MVYRRCCCCFVSLFCVTFPWLLSILVLLHTLIPLCHWRLLVFLPRILKRHPAWVVMALSRDWLIGNHTSFRQLSQTDWLEFSVRPYNDGPLSSPFVSGSRGCRSSVRDGGAFWCESPLKEIAPPDPPTNCRVCTVYKCLCVCVCVDGYDVK